MRLFLEVTSASVAVDGAAIIARVVQNMKVTSLMSDTKVNENKKIENIDLFVDNDFITSRNKIDLLRLQDMQEKYSEEIYADEDSEIKRDFFDLDKKISNESIQIDYTYTSDMLEKLFEQLGLDIKVTKA